MGMEMGMGMDMGMGMEMDEAIQVNTTTHMPLKVEIFREYRSRIEVRRDVVNHRLDRSKTEPKGCLLHHGGYQFGDGAALLQCGVAVK